MADTLDDKHVKNIILAPVIITTGLIFQSIFTNSFDGLFALVIPIIATGIGVGVNIIQEDEFVNNVIGVIAIGISLYYFTYFISLVSRIPRDINVPIILIILLSFLLAFVIAFAIIVSDKIKFLVTLGILFVSCGLGYGWAQLARKLGLNFFPDKDGKRKNVKCSRRGTQPFTCSVFNN